MYNNLFLRSMEVKVLGTGCSKCKTLYNVVEKIVRDNNLEVTLTKVEDIVQIMTFNVMSLPAIVIDGEVKVKGRVPSESEIRDMLGL